MKKFLICLAPAIIGYIMVIVGVSGGMVSKGGSGMDTLILSAIIIHAIGAIIAGVFVAQLVYRSMEGGKMAKVLVGLLLFFTVSASYFSLVVAGGCGLALATGIALQ